MSKKTYKPGETVPDSGIAQQIGPRGGKGGHATVVSGEPFPPTAKPGSKWVIVKKTPKK